MLGGLADFVIQNKLALLIKKILLAYRTSKEICCDAKYDTMGLN